MTAADKWVKGVNIANGEWEANRNLLCDFVASLLDSSMETLLNDIVKC